MAIFKFSDRRVELEFPGDIKCSLPLTEEMRDKIKEVSENLVKTTQKLKAETRNGTEEDYDELCNLTLDAVAEILGEDVTDSIMDQKEGYSFLDCADLFKFVVDEFTAAYIQTMSSYNASNKKPAEQVSAPPANRAQRRRRRRKH